MRSKVCKVALHFGSFLISISDCFSDWLLYQSARTTDQGLVYGRLEPGQVTAMLVFAVIGSVLFIAEIVAFVIDVRETVQGKGYQATDPYKDVLSTFITLFEDIPQVVISFAILQCREERISIFQLITAILYLVGICKRVFDTALHCSRQTHFKCWLFIVELIHIIGLLVLMGFAVLVFILSQTEKAGDFGINIRKPSTVFTAYVSDQKYFAGVGVFIRDAGLPHTLKGDNISDNWMRLFPIYELKAAKKISMKLTYSHASNGYFNMGIWLQALSANIKSWNLSECYNITQDTATITPQSNVICLNDVASGDNFDAVYMDFRFQFPESNPVVQKLVFGEIYYNWKISTNGSCTSWDSFDSSVSGHSPNVSFLSYFRVNNSSNVYTNKHFYSVDRNETRYFSSVLEDITSVDEIWKTGWEACPSTGSMSPVFDTNMNVECN